MTTDCPSQNAPESTTLFTKVQINCKADNVVGKCGMTNVRQSPIFGNQIQAARCKGFQKEFAKQQCLKCNSQLITNYCFICDRSVTLHQPNRFAWCNKK